MLLIAVEGIDEQAFDDARTRRDGIEIRAVIRPRGASKR
jgi:hypothetical protein